MIPFVDLKTQYRNLKAEMDAAVMGVLERCQFTLGPETAAFETEFAAFCGVKHAVGVNSGTSALHLALLAADIGEGDEVITTPYTFIATVAAIRYAGATPVLVDVDPKTYTISAEQVAAAVTERTRAILPVHLYGQCADMPALQKVADKHKLVLIEDAAQAHGAEHSGKRAGALGDLGCFSFYPSKNLGACGEGGMVVTDNDDHASKLRQLRDWGQEAKGEHVMRGFNYRIEEIQAAILRVKLRHLADWNDVRVLRAADYNELLESLPVTTPFVATDRKHVYHVYSILSAERDALRRGLGQQEIQTGVHYGIPVHLQASHADLGHSEGDFPVSESLCKKVMSLPIFPEMTREQVETVAGVIRELTGS